MRSAGRFHGVGESNLLTNDVHTGPAAAARAPRPTVTAPRMIVVIERVLEKRAPIGANWPAISGGGAMVARAVHGTPTVRRSITSAAAPLIATEADVPVIATLTGTILQSSRITVTATSAVEARDTE